mgnify:CR=1 FL=1
MELIAPLGPVYQAGTLSGNPLAMTAGIETLRKSDPKGFPIEDHNIPDFMDALHCGVGDILCEAWRQQVPMTAAPLP